MQIVPKSREGWRSSFWEFANSRRTDIFAAKKIS
jgi:hypothetical protein